MLEGKDKAGEVPETFNEWSATFPGTITAPAASFFKQAQTEQSESEEHDRNNQHAEAECVSQQRLNDAGHVDSDWWQYPFC